MRQNLMGVTDGPLILPAAMDRKRAEVSQQRVKRRVEQLSLAHKKDRTRERELHRKDIEIRIVIRRNDDSTVQREIFQPFHFHHH